MSERYSQQAEQDYVLAAFPDLSEALPDSRDPRRFLDIGAFNATCFSNTRALWLRGWSGICIEPSPGPVRALVEAYGDGKRVQVIAAAVGLEPGLIQMHISDDAVSTSDEAAHEKWKTAGGYIGLLTVPCLTLEDIFQRFGGDFAMVNIDVEIGSVDLCLEMLRIGPRPHVICVEHDNRLTELLSKTNEEYVPTMTNDCNVILVHR